MEGGRPENAASSDLLARKDKALLRNGTENDVVCVHRPVKLMITAITVKISS